MSFGKSRRQSAGLAVFRAIVDQFVARTLHPRSDVEQFEKLALGFIEALDSESLAEVAYELSVHAETPASIVARLLDKGGRAAQIALEFATSIPAAELLATAEYGPIDFAAAIARRAELRRPLVSSLVSRREQRVLRNLAANRTAHLDQSARRVLVQAGRDDPELARILLDRDDLELSCEPLFLAARRAERALMIVEASAKALAAGAFDSTRPASYLGAQIESCAARYDKEALTETLADALDCRKSRVRAILADEGGEALALVLSALGLGQDAAIRVFFCANPGISRDLEHLRSLIALMRSTPVRAAQRLVAAITGSFRSEKDSSRRQSTQDGGASTQSATPREALRSPMRARKSNHSK